MAGFGKIKGGISLPATTALNSAVYGIYTAAEAEAYRKLGLWPTAPTVPGAPTDVSGVLGNAQALLTWSAPANNGGASITDYAIQYSSNNGTTWTAFTDSTSTDTLATVTNLINDTAYIFRVAAVNAVGAGSYSAASNSVTPSATTASVQYLLVAGGGGGGGNSGGGGDGGGGGGAGGLLAGFLTLTAQDVVSVSVGAGGAYDTSGQNSVFSSFTAIGGGRGGINGPKTNGANGGSGGGVGRDGCTSPGAGTAGQGYAGGTTACGGWNSAGGGGGAGEAGYDGAYDQGGISGTAGKGGDGVASSITGTLTYYAGGGGGGYNSSASGNAAQGGLGGGGNGAAFTAQNGAANTGGGGGGGRSGAGGSGGSGVAIVAYPATYPELAIAPSLTYTQPTRAGYRVYSFTAGSGLIAFQNQTAVPSAPTNLAVVPGSEQVSLSWTGAFSAGPSVSDYVIQYSSDDGISWTTFSDGTSTSTSATVTGLTNGTTYKFRVAAVNSIGTGDYSATITGTPFSALIITAQPKNDYATATSQNITFSVATSGGGAPTYQWQYYGPDEPNNDYNSTWRNIPSATAASYVTNGNTLGNLLSYEFYYTGMAKLRCVVTAEGGASTVTSDIVRFVELDYLHSAGVNWYGSQGNYVNYVHYTQPSTFSPAVGENLVLDFYDYSMGYPDTSWYTGNDTTLKIQVATNGYTDSADWTDLHTQDSRGSVYLSGYNITPSTGTKYYRAILVDKWPYAVNNGTQSATRTPQHVYPNSTNYIVQVTWPAPPPVLTMTRSNNGGTITGWSGTGTAASPFTRSAGYELDNFEGLTYYSWTAGAAATVTFVFDYSDDSGNGENYQIMLMSGGPPYAVHTNVTGMAITKTVSVIAGDVLFFSSTGNPADQYFANVSVSATAT